ITPAKTTELRAARVTFIYQPFARGDEIIKDVLSIFAHAGAMPFFAEFSAASRVDDGVDSSALQERDHMRRKRRQQTDAKAAISMNHRRIVAVARDPSLMNQEHRYARLVSRFKPDLFDREILRIKSDFVLMNEFISQRFQIHAVNSPRR